MLLHPTDTIPLLAAARLSAQRHAQQQQQADDLARARTGADQLRAVGVLVTEDTAMENAFQWQNRRTEADRRGVSIDTVTAEREFAQALQEVKALLQDAVRRGETEDEWYARVQSALSAAPIGAKKSNGKPCKHKSTQREQAWYNRVGGYTMIASRDGVHPFRCGRCGVEVNVPVRPEAPSEQARIAQIILANEDEASGQEPA